MQRFKHLLLDLALDGQDEALLHWAEHIATLSQSQKITIIHSWETADIPTTVKEKYPWLVAPGKEVLKTKMEALIKSELSEQWWDRVDLKLLEGERIQTVLKVARAEEVDLVITARKTPNNEPDQYAARIARKSPCSVFCVETTKAANYTKVLVPVDFSEHSNRAYDFGAALARAAGISEVCVLRSYGIPYGQHKAMMSRDEFAADYKKFESERLETYILHQGPKDIYSQSIVVESPVPAYGIAKYVSAEGIDVVVLGSRGAHAVSALLLGSTTEAIINEVSCSILVIKPKGTGLSLLDSLLGD